jgi:hypothetical protein
VIVRMVDEYKADNQESKRESERNWARRTEFMKSTYNWTLYTPHRRSMPTYRC